MVSFQSNSLRIRKLSLKEDSKTELNNKTDVKQKNKKIKKNNIKLTDMERKLSLETDIKDKEDRKLYMDYNLIRNGFDKIGHDSEKVIVKSPRNPVIDRSVINLLWRGPVKVIQCHRRGHLVHCNV